MTITTITTTREWYKQNYTTEKIPHQKVNANKSTDLSTPFLAKASTKAFASFPTF